MPEHQHSGGDPDEPEATSQHEVEHAAELFGRGVRTALRNNATAYGFSISITTAYGLVSAINSEATAAAIISFALGAAVAFVAVGAIFIARFPLGSLREGGQVATISGGIDILSVIGSIAVAFGLSRVPGFIGWPLTAFGTVVSYLLISGLDVVLARAVARRTSFARSQ